jgi:hypothetical protein
VERVITSFIKPRKKGKKNLSQTASKAIRVPHSGQGSKEIRFRGVDIALLSVVVVEGGRTFLSSQAPA